MTISIILNTLLATFIIGSLFSYFEIVHKNKWQTTYAKVANAIAIYGGIFIAFISMDILEHALGFNHWIAFLVVIIPAIFAWDKIDRACQIWIAKRGYY